MLVPSPSGFDRSSPNRGRSSVTPGMDFSNLVSGWPRVDLSSRCGNHISRKVQRYFSSNEKKATFLSATEQFNEVLKLNMQATGYCLFSLVFQNCFSRYQNFWKRISFSWKQELDLHVKYRCFDNRLKTKRMESCFAYESLLLYQRVLGILATSLCNMFFIFFSFLPYQLFIPPSFVSIPGCVHVDKRLKQIESQLQRGEKVTGGLLTYILVANEMSIEEIYANVTEMLLAGVDTVRLGLLIHCGGGGSGGGEGVIRSGELQDVFHLIKQPFYISNEHFYNIRAALLPHHRVITPHTNHFRCKIKELKNIHNGKKVSLETQALKFFPGCICGCGCKLHSSCLICLGQCQTNES